MIGKLCRASKCRKRNGQSASFFNRQQFLEKFLLHCTIFEHSLNTPPGRSNSHRFSDKAAMRHIDHKESSLDAPAALGLLINLSGKMRMLSHRIAMFILCNALNAPADENDERLPSALAEFRQIHATLRNGDPRLGISRAVITMISDEEALGPQSHSIIESFIARTEALMNRPQPESFNAFVEFVAGPLLDRLNLITNHISHALEQLHERQRQQAVSSEGAVHEALGAIEKVSISVRIIAINAATEAVRAGEFGRGFSIIAKEIRALSDRAAELVQSVRTNLQSTSGA